VAAADLLALARLSRRLSEDWFLIGTLVSISLERMAVGALTALAGDPQADAAFLRNLREGLDALPARMPMARADDQGERLLTLSMVVGCARRRRGEVLSDYLGSPEDLPSGVAVEWNRVLCTVNETVDGQLRCLREPDPRRRQQLRKDMEVAREARHERIQELQDFYESWRGRVGGFLASAAARRQWLTDWYMGVFDTPATWVLVDVRDKLTAQREVLRTGIALRLHVAGGNEVPATPDAAQAAVGDWPDDPMTGDPLRYRRTDEAFVVYSVGRDRQDDGGPRPDDPLYDGDDIGFRFPAGQ